MARGEDIYSGGGDIPGIDGILKSFGAIKMGTECLGCFFKRRESVNIQLFALMGTEVSHNLGMLMNRHPSVS